MSAVKPAKPSLIGPYTPLLRLSPSSSGANARVAEARAPGGCRFSLRGRAESVLDNHASFPDEEARPLAKAGLLFAHSTGKAMNLLSETLLANRDREHGSGLLQGPGPTVLKRLARAYLSWQHML